MPTSKYSPKQLRVAARALAEENGWPKATLRIIQELGLEGADAVEAVYLLEHVVNATAAERDAWSAVDVPDAAAPGPAMTFSELVKRLMVDRKLSEPAAQAEATRLLSGSAAAPATEPLAAMSFSDLTTHTQLARGLSFTEAQAEASRRDR